MTLVRESLAAVALVCAGASCSGKVEDAGSDGGPRVDASDGSTVLGARGDGTISAADGEPDVTETGAVADGGDEAAAEDACADATGTVVCYEQGSEWICPCEYQSPACPAGTHLFGACDWEGGCYFCQQSAGIYCACESPVSDAGSTWSCAGAGNGCS
jgi:hypothetical protein